MTAQFRNFMIMSIPAMAMTAASPAGLVTFTGSSVDEHGTGFGHVLNILALHQNGSEFGSVSPGSGGEPVLFGDATHQSRLLSVADLTGAGIGGHSFSLIFNINEPGSSPEVTLQNFSMEFYDANGSQMFNAVYGGPNLTLLPVAMGTGGAGWLFQVDLTPAETTLFFSNPNNMLGMTVPEDSPILNTWGGPENFFVMPVPAPATLAMLAILIGASPVRRRRDH